MTARNENEEYGMDSESGYIVNAFGVAVNVFLKLRYPENKKEFQNKLYSKATPVLLAKVNPTPTEYAC